MNGRNSAEAADMSEVVWVVGNSSGVVGDDTVWSLVGIFTTEAEAVAECYERSHFVAPVTVGKAQHEDVEWAGCYYPLAGAQ